MEAIKAVLKRGVFKVALALGLGALLVGPAGCVVIVPSSACVEEERLEVERKVRVPIVVPAVPEVVVPVCTPVPRVEVVVPVCTPVPQAVIVVPVCTPVAVCPTAVPEIVVCPTQVICPTAAPTMCPTMAALTQAPAATAMPSAPVTPEVLPQTGRRLHVEP